jgi:hypothetical protein
MSDAAIEQIPLNLAIRHGYVGSLHATWCEPNLCFCLRTAGGDADLQILPGKGALSIIIDPTYVCVAIGSLDQQTRYIYISHGIILSEPTASERGAYGEVYDVCIGWVEIHHRRFQSHRHIRVQSGIPLGEAIGQVGRTQEKTVADGVDEGGNRFVVGVDAPY